MLTLVFLHGFLGSGKSWRNVTAALQENYYCVTPDLPGHGENTRLDMHAPLDFDSVSDWLAGLLNQLPVSKICLAGYSLGGRIALHFAIRHPERIHSLILESASPGLADESERARRLAEDSARAEFILKEGMSAFVEQWYEMPLFASLKKHPQTLSAIKEAAKTNDPRWMAKVIRDLSPGLQTPLWDSLATLSVPVLLMAGAKDEKYVQVIRNMEGKIPNAQSILAPQAGHNIHAEQPETYIRLINDFLAQWELP